jgi:hypothetical protein
VGAGGWLEQAASTRANNSANAPTKKYLDFITFSSQVMIYMPDVGSEKSDPCDFEYILFFTPPWGIYRFIDSSIGLVNTITILYRNS